VIIYLLIHDAFEPLILVKTVWWHKNYAQKKVRREYGKEKIREKIRVVFFKNTSRDSKSGWSVDTVYSEILTPWAPVQWNLRVSLVRFPSRVEQAEKNQASRLGLYTETIDLSFEPFFAKEIRRVIDWLREIKTADQHCYRFILIQQNKFFGLNVN